MDRVRIANTGGAVRELESRPLQNSRGATLDVTNPMPTEYEACRLLTKAGEACKAPPIKGEPFCAGHRRQVEAG